MCIIHVRTLMAFAVGAGSLERSVGDVRGQE